MSILQEDTKKVNKNVKGPVVKQFQWFQMQTRVRKIIQQIIDPIQYQIFRNLSQIQKLEENDRIFQDRIQYMLKMTTNDPQVFEKGVFRKIEQKFQDQQKTLTFLEEQVKNNTSFINNKINLIDERMKQSNDMISQIEQLKTSNRQNLKDQTQKFDRVRRNIEENVQNMSVTIDDNQKVSRQKTQDIQKQIATSLIKMQNIIKDFRQVRQLFQSQRSINDSLIAQGIGMKQQSKHMQAKISEASHKVKQLSKIKPFLQDVWNESRKMLFKVDNIVPLINQAQINECLYKVLPQKFHSRVAVYQFQKYLQLNQKVLSRHFESDPTSMNFNGQLLIRESQQRNTKLLTKLKRSYYRNQGVDLDFISYQERQKLLTAFDYPKLCQIVDQLQEMDNEKNDRKKNHKLTQQGILSLVDGRFEKDKSLLTQKIQIELRDTKTYLVSSSQQVHKLFQKLEEKHSNLSRELQSYQNKKDLQSKNSQHITKGFSLSLNQTLQKLNTVHDFNKQVWRYIQTNDPSIKKVHSEQKKVNPQQKIVNPEQKKVPTSDSPNVLSVGNEISIKKFAHFDSGKIRSQTGVVIASDSEDIFNLRIIQQKQLNSDSQKTGTQRQELEESFIANLKKSLLEFEQLNEQQKVKTPNKFKHSSPKLTRPSYNQIRFKSQSSFDFKLHKKQLAYSQLNKSSQVNMPPQKSEVKGLLNIPSLKNQNRTKYCRQSHTSRLGSRKKPSFTLSKTTFQDGSLKTKNIQNSEVRNSLACFYDLRRQNGRYLE